MGSLWFYGDGLVSFLFREVRFRKFDLRRCSQLTDKTDGWQMADSLNEHLGVRCGRCVGHLNQQSGIGSDRLRGIRSTVKSFPTAPFQIRIHSSRQSSNAHAHKMEKYAFSQARWEHRKYALKTHRIFIFIETIITRPLPRNAKLSLKIYNRWALTGWNLIKMYCTTTTIPKFSEVLSLWEMIFPEFASSPSIWDTHVIRERIGVSRELSEQFFKFTECSLPLLQRIDWDYQSEPSNGPPTGKTSSAHNFFLVDAGALFSVDGVTLNPYTYRAPKAW